MLAGIVTTAPLTVTLTLASGTYYFVVTAYNNDGDGLPSNEVSFVAP